MYNQYIEKLLRMPEVKLQTVEMETNQEIYLLVRPVAYVQPCPLCQSTQSVIRKGTNGIRTIRHLSCFEVQVYLRVPAIRMFCKNCECGFVWQYTFVEPKKRYSTPLRTYACELALGSTCQHMAQMHGIPHSTLHRLYCLWVLQESARVQHIAWEQALAQNELILGVDDFAIRKGHTYNTGLHDLRGGTLLDVISGRTLEELRAYSTHHPFLSQLRVKAVVMDLARSYHTWIRELFPTALRIADRFHVMKYLVEVLHVIRREVQRALAPHARNRLKKYHRLLHARQDSLPDDQRRVLTELLAYHSLLKEVYEWKEALTVWYECAPNYTIGQIWFQRFLEQGEAIDHPAVQGVLRTMKNWEEEITNYHLCRYTNAAVEGRNNKMKAFQRSKYFHWSREYYVKGLLVHCNKYVLTA